VLHQVGSGVLGPVFRAHDPQSDRLVAIKAFRLDLLPEDVARLADGLRRLTAAPGFVAAGLEGMSGYLATAYEDGETLDVALRRLAPAPLDAALPILRAAAGVIDDAWAAGVGHGALHPRDMFVRDGGAGVTGFGVSAVLEGIGAKPVIRRPYTAPERAAGQPWDIRADVFSLAAIAHELLTGRRPAGPGEQDGALPARMSVEWRAHVRRVLSKGLAEDPTQRFPNCRAFVDALADVTSLPEPAAPVTIPEEDFTDAPQPPGGPSALTLFPVADEPHEDFDLTHLLREMTAPDTDEIEPLPQATAATAETGPLNDADTASQADELSPTPTRRAPSRTRTVAMPVARPASAGTLAPEEPAPVTRDAAPLPAAFAMPPSFPWAAMVAVAVASLVIGAVGMHQYDQYRAGTLVTAPDRPGDAGAASGGSGAADTEVTVPPAPQEPGPAPAPAPGKSATTARGRLTVRSVPTGALVTIDGRPVGRTPVTVSDLSLDTHTVVIARPGYDSVTRRPTLSSRTTAATVSVTLSALRPPPTAAVGSVAVDSRPRGARITIDGRAVGQTPASVPGLSPGRHSVRLELSGYKPLVTSVIVKAGETARIAVSLEEGK
jgi:serine/threonine protein kinase